MFVSTSTLDVMVMLFRGYMCSAPAIACCHLGLGVSSCMEQLAKCFVVINFVGISVSGIL